MSDPLSFNYESTPACWRCNYDPEGPQGFGPTRQAALADLLFQCDDMVQTLRVAAAILALNPNPTWCQGCHPDNCQGCGGDSSLNQNTLSEKP